MRKIRHLILTAALSVILIAAAAVSASALSDIVLDSASDASSVRIEGTALPEQWVSVKVTYQDTEIAYFNGQVTGGDGSYSFDADLSDYSAKMPLDLTVTCGNTVETSQIRLAGGSSENPGGGSGGGGGGGGGTTPAPSDEDSVTVNDGGHATVTVTPENAEEGDVVTVTVTPDSGYTTDAVSVMDEDGQSVSTEDNGNGTYTFTMPAGKVTIDVTCRAQETPGTGGGFSDVSDSAWYKDAVDYVVSNGYFNGVSSTEFNPDGTMTRAMFATAVGRLAGVDESAYAGSSFSDVPAGQWYSAYVKWASDNGIVNGVGDGRFDPNGEITREQMAALLYRYAQYAGVDVTPAAGAAAAFASFADSASVSDYARDAMTWAVGAGIINGSDGSLMPQADATRAQVAQIIRNYAETVA